MVYVDSVVGGLFKYCFLYFLLKSLFFVVTWNPILCFFNKAHYYLNIFKHLVSFDKSFSTESILEEFTETVHVLLCETYWVQFL